MTIQVAEHNSMKSASASLRSQPFKPSGCQKPVRKGPYLYAGHAKIHAAGLTWILMRATVAAGNAASGGADGSVAAVAAGG
eukprot:scaffold141883_cov13-Tisochrysis_lutea.AAC.1